MSENKKIIIGGIYKHYKGHEYKVLNVAKNSENKEHVVVYQDLADENKVWIRPEKEFLEDVKLDGQKIPRFRLIGEDKDSFQSMYLRALADYQNLLKRTAFEKEEFAKFANEQIILEIIPVYDNLKTSILHSDDEAAKNGWLEGIKYIIKQFKDVLNNLGVEELQTEGKKFDHHTMEAIEGKGERVKKEVRAGYKLKGKLIVPARVILE
jgi:molecular chaperone GrpE